MQRPDAPASYVLPLESKLRTFALMQPERGDFRKELLAASEEVAALKRKLRLTQKALREARRSLRSWEGMEATRDA